MRLSTFAGLAFTLATIIGGSSSAIARPTRTHSGLKWVCQGQGGHRSNGSLQTVVGLPDTDQERAVRSAVQVCRKEGLLDCRSLACFEREPEVAPMPDGPPHP